MWRIFALVAVILDAGCRIDELLTSRVQDFDHDQRLLTVYGKGRKQRRMPFDRVAQGVRFRQRTERSGITCELMLPAREAAGTSGTPFVATTAC